MKNIHKRGFTYLGLLALIAIISLASTAPIAMYNLARKRDAEMQLIEAGNAYRLALKSYHDATPPGQDPTPARLEYLLKDPRFPQARRHLRQLYPDPVTGSSNWGLILSASGGIIGVYSRSDAKPLKVNNFSNENALFAEQTQYSDWLFFYGIDCRNCKRANDNTPLNISSSSDTRGNDEEKK